MRRGVSSRLRQIVLITGIAVVTLGNYVGLQVLLQTEPELALRDPVASSKSQSAPSKASSSHKTRYGPTFLFGIPSVQSEMERRKAVRETYLSYYKESEEPNRVCSLVDLQNHKVPWEDCQIAYVFFLGGNPHGPTELVKPNVSFPMTIPNPRNVTNEEDVIYLNIKENLEDGKSQTWLKYAAMVIQDEFPFDYIVKADSDTLVFTPSFLEFAEKRVPKRPNNIRIYGGYAHGPTSCKTGINDTHSCPLPLVGGSYMGGAFYWMSLDLAEFVTSDAIDRSSLTIRHEDVDIGNFIFSHPKPITSIEVKGSRLLIHRLRDGDWAFRNKAHTFRDTYWAHSELGFFPGPFFKNLHHYRKMWRQFRAFRLSGQKLVTKDIYELYDLPDNVQKDFIRTNDYIYSKQDFDSSPIVLESHKLIFFTVADVGDTAWRCLFRRMMGYKDWQDTSQQFDGLRYLYDYTVSEATTMMTSPDYTRAIFVRDPKIRVLSSWLEHVVKDNGNYIRWPCCGGRESCVRNNLESFGEFLELINDCDEPYWRPQAQKMEPRYFHRLNFVGHYATLKDDARLLLEQIGAWDDYGRSGWGQNDNDGIFHSVPVLSESVFEQHYTRDLQKKAQKRYKVDYDAKSILNLTRRVSFEYP